MPVDQSVVTTFINALASKPEFLLLSLVLIGGGWVVFKLGLSWIEAFKFHGETVATQLKIIADSATKLNDKVDNLSDRLERIAEEVSHHDRRIERLEDTK